MSLMLWIRAAKRSTHFNRFARFLRLFSFGLAGGGVGGRSTGGGGGGGATSFFSTLPTLTATLHVFRSVVVGFAA
jgi:hypothetical protein